MLALCYILVFIFCCCSFVHFSTSTCAFFYSRPLMVSFRAFLPCLAKGLLCISKWHRWINPCTRAHVYINIIHKKSFHLSCDISCYTGCFVTSYINIYWCIIVMHGMSCDVTIIACDLQNIICDITIIVFMLHTDAAPDVLWCINIINSS